VRKTQNTVGGGFRALLLAGSASAVALTYAAPAYAQDDEGSDEPIIVTGSRIQRQDYESNSPIVTVGSELLENSSTASVEVNLNKLPQFTPEKTPTAGGDIQATPTNTPGSATVSLRGIGSNRNLVLIDGRRGTPANSSGAVDINTIPSAAIERVEIISGGASSTYGADAVGGVVNFILKKNFEGIQIDAQYGITERGDGEEYSISGIMGTDFADGRGNISIAMATSDRAPSFRGNRPWYRELWANPNVDGNYFFPIYSGITQTGQNPNYQAVLNSLFPNATGDVSQFGSLYFLGNTPFTLGVNAASADPLAGISNFPTELIDGVLTKQNANGGISQNFQEDYINLPLNRFNFYGRGNYEITDWLSVVAQGYFNKSHTETVQQPGPIVGGWNVVIPRYANDDTWLPSNLVTLLNARTDPDAAWSVTGYVPGLGNREVITDVTTYNLVAGFEGSIPGTDWVWDVTGSRGESISNFLTTGVASLERLRAVMSAPNFGAGFVQQGNATGGGFGANRATCTTGLNPFNGQTPSQDCVDAIRADLKESAVMEQTIWEANAAGTLFELPAGNLGVAIGATYRENDYSFLEDTLKEVTSSFLDQALGIYPARSIDASLNSKEVYGEVAIPLIHNTPGIEMLEVVGGIRYADSNITGGSTTWKAEVNWEVTNWLRFRASYNRAERAPNVGELFSFTQNFGLLTGGDACSLGNPFSYSAGNDPNVEALCRQLMDKSSIPGQPANSDQYYGNAGLGIAPSTASQSTSTAPGFAFPYFVGNPDLTPEKAKTLTVGAVINSPFDSPVLSGLRLSVDYYSIEVDDAIGLQSGQTLQQLCLDSAFNPNYDPNTFFCENFQRGTGGGIGAVRLAYTNTGYFKTEGVDAQLDWNFDLGPGRFSLNSVFNYLITMKASPFYSGVPEESQTPLFDYAGTLLAPPAGLSANGNYEWKLLTNIGYSYENYRIGLQWQHLPSIDSGTTNTGLPAYDVLSLNGSVQAYDNVTFRFGVDNLLDEAPPFGNSNPNPVYPAVSGGGLNTTNYDALGRRYYFGVTTKF